MSTWTLLYGGTEKSFADWGLHSLRRSQSSQSQYQVTFTGQRQAFDATPQFAYGETVVIKKDGVQWWKGPVISTPSFGSATTERIDYAVASPWWHLENIVYQQAWAYFTGTEYTAKYSSHVFLGQTITWFEEDGTTPLTIPVQSRAETNVVIKEILDWAIGICGSEFAYYAPDLADANTPMHISIPVDEAREINCAEAVRRITKWLRDLVIWWDFTTSTPTLRFQRRAALDTAALVIGTKPLAEIELTPRYDLQVDAVCLKYEKTDTVDEMVCLNITEKIYPVGKTGLEMGAMVCTIDLRGVQATNVYATLKAEAIYTGADQSLMRAWWARRYPWMLDTNIDTIVFSDFARESSLLNELTEGTWAPWITGVTCEQDVLEATADVKYKPGTASTQESTKKLSAKLTVTNAPVGTNNYSTTSEFDPGDEVPIGLEIDLYNSLAVLQYSGRITLKEAECGDWLTTQSISPQSGIGLKVNVTGGTGVYATIAAMVQNCDEDIDSGSTSLTVGPPEQLSPQDLVALLQVTRTRQIFNNPKTRAQGLGATGGGVNYPQDSARESASTHTVAYKKQTVSSANASIINDATDTDHPVTTWKNSYDTTATVNMSEANSKNIAFREYDICVAGVAKKVMLWGSVPY